MRLAVVGMLTCRGWCLLKSKKKPKSAIVDVLSYCFSPKMEIVNEKMKSQILEKYRLSSFEQLPKFKSTDPAVKALGAKPGDLIKIYREDMTGKYIAYRYVLPK